MNVQKLHKHTLWQKISVPSTFFMLFRHFRPLFGDATSIIFACHSGHEFFCANYDLHDVPSILQSKSRCFEMSAADETMKLMSKMLFLRYEVISPVK